MRADEYARETLVIQVISGKKYIAEEGEGLPRATTGLGSVLNKFGISRPPKLEEDRGAYFICSTGRGRCSPYMLLPAGRGHFADGGLRLRPSHRIQKHVLL